MKKLLLLSALLISAPLTFADEDPLNANTGTETNRATISNDEEFLDEPAQNEEVQAEPGLEKQEDVELQQGEEEIEYDPDVIGDDEIELND